VGRGTKRFVQVVERLNEASGILAQAGLFALFLIVCWEVLTRYLLRDPSVFSAEVSEYLMVLLTFASAGLIMKDGRHVRWRSWWLVSDGGGGPWQGSSPKGWCS